MRWNGPPSHPDGLWTRQTGAAGTAHANGRDRGNEQVTPPNSGLQKTSATTRGPASQPRLVQEYSRRVRAISPGGLQRLPAQASGSLLADPGHPGGGDTPSWPGNNARRPAPAGRTPATGWAVDLRGTRWVGADPAAAWRAPPACCPVHDRRGPRVPGPQRPGSAGRTHHPWW
jgi:hypothetical protein